MNFAYTRYNLSPREYQRERLFEVIPGLTSWSIILGMLFLSLYQPVVAAVCIIAFDFFWLLKLFYMTIFLVVSYVRLTGERNTDWMSLIRQLQRYSTHGPSGKSTSCLEQMISYIHRKELSEAVSRDIPSFDDREIIHLVIFPILKETRQIVEPSLRSLRDSVFPSQQIMVVLTVEDRASDAVKADARELFSQYKEFFYDFHLYFHPDGLPGEARVKGANATFAARKAAGVFQAQGVSFEKITVSCFDADTIIHPDYFACLTYYFMLVPERERTSFQPIPVYHNNIWNAHNFARILDIGSSFFQLIEATDPAKLVTFSSHSMSFKTLVEIDYWPVDIISDDSAIFWKAFIHYDGNYSVMPMYVTVSMDVVEAGSWSSTVVNVYRQKRRWAWGVENFPMVMRAFCARSSISRYSKIRYALKLYENHVSWATWPFLLGIIGWIPILVSRSEFSSTVLFYNAPRITSTIFHLATISLVVSMLLSMFLLPRSQKRHYWFKRLLHSTEWVLIPLVSLLFSALPALDAQTRLMFGTYMEFWVTDKLRKNDPAT